MRLNRRIVPVLLSAAVSVYDAGIVKGTVVDRLTGEPLVGARVKADSGAVMAATDVEGRYFLDLKDGRHTIAVSYISYVDTVVGVSVLPGTELSVVDFAMSPDATALSEVVVTAMARKDTKDSMIEEERQSAVVQSGVSAQQIARTQDKDASEVIRRVPDISIIDDKFVMVRGLSQRYNNVWLNGGAVPSSEADSRAFSFSLSFPSQFSKQS